MKAVLVAQIEDDKLYYDLDATSEDRDAVLVRPDNSMIKVDLFDFANSCGSLLRIRTSKFHKFLWGGVNKKNWKATFIDKTKPINENMIDELDIYEVLGEKKKKLDKVAEKTSKFKKTVNSKKKKNEIKTKSAQPCCDDEVVEFDMSNLVFNDAKSRKEAWTAMILLRQLEE